MQGESATHFFGQGTFVISTISKWLWDESQDVKREALGINEHHNTKRTRFSFDRCLRYADEIKKYTEDSVKKLHISEDSYKMIYEATESFDKALFDITCYTKDALPWKRPWWWIGQSLWLIAIIVIFILIMLKKQ